MSLSPAPREELVLRQWTDADLEPYAAMNADPEVMRYFPALLTKEETAASLDRLRRGIDERGWGLWAVAVDGVFAGFTGLNTPSFSAHFTPCIEIGWRFRREYWGRSLAFRAAREALRFGFEVLKLTEIVSFTAATNDRSRRLMERLGLVWDANGDFDHPSITEGHALRRHVLYRIRAETPWLRQWVFQPTVCVISKSIAHDSWLPIACTKGAIPG
jgi:RimJ/RimL family protein N-acetyltransferase